MSDLSAPEPVVKWSEECTGLDALAEAHRVNEASGVYAQQRAIEGRRR